MAKDREEVCCAGCAIYYGGERKHLKEYVFYPESLTRMNDIKIAELESLVVEARNLLFEYKDEFTR